MSQSPKKHGNVLFFHWLFVDWDCFSRYLFQALLKTCSKVIHKVFASPGGLALEPRNLQRGAPWWHESDDWQLVTRWLPNESDPWSESRFRRKNVKNWTAFHKKCHINSSPVFTFFTIQKHPILNGGGSRNSPPRPSLGHLWLGLGTSLRRFTKKHGILFMGNIWELQWDLYK